MTESYCRGAEPCATLGRPESEQPVSYRLTSYLPRRAMWDRIVAFSAAATLAACAPAPVTSAVAPSAAYDLVIRGGRVMDPETGLDAVRDVGVREGRIAAISETPLTGRETIDAAGHVVAPGFIDLHAHGQDSVSRTFQVLDGVTTALEQEGGVFPVRRWYEAQERQGSIVNFGATVSHGGARRAAMGAAVDESGATSGAARPSAATRPRALYAAASAAEVQHMAELMTRGVEEGALGFGFGINYTPGATPQEIETLFRAAAAAQAPVFVHTRDFGLEAIREVTAAAERTGASLHVVHIGSSAARVIADALATIDSARARGGRDDGSLSVHGRLHAPGVGDLRRRLPRETRHRLRGHRALGDR